MISNGSNEGHGEGVTRSDLIDSGIRNLAAAVAAVGMVASTAAGNDLAHAADVREPEMTSKCYIEVTNGGFVTAAALCRVGVSTSRVFSAIPLPQAAIFTN